MKPDNNICGSFTGATATWYNSSITPDGSGDTYQCISGSTLL